jgi:hypothetical protein
MSNQPLADPAALAQQLAAAANSLSDEEAARRYQQILAQLPKEEAAKLNTLALTQVAPDQRRVLASGLKAASQDPARPFDGYNDDDDDAAAAPQRLGQLTAQAARQDPELTNNLLGGNNSALGGQIGKAALAALAALLIKHLVSGQGQQAPGQAPAAGGLDLGGLLGGLVGGALGGQAQAGGHASASGPDLGSLLGGLLGGATGAQQAPAGGADLGSLLGGLLGGQAQAGGQASAAGGPDLGALLGGLLGGTGGTSYRKE